MTSVLSANLTRVTVRQNEDMRKISAWVAMAAVPTMVAGIYGMNFEHMPELGWVAGYPVCPRRDGGGLRADVPVLPPERLAVSDGRRGVAATRSAGSTSPAPSAARSPIPGEEDADRCPRCGAERQPSEGGVAG